MQTRAESSIVKPKKTLSLVSSITKVEPRSFSTTSKHAKWVDAMKEECRALVANDT